jgi:hypothetical protein
MKRRSKLSKLNSQFSKLTPDEQEQALKFVAALGSARKEAEEQQAGAEPEVPNMLDLIDELNVEIMRLNLLYDFTSYVDPDTFRFTSGGATGLNLFIGERLDALRRISKGIYSSYKSGKE